MKALTFHGPTDFRLETVPDPRLVQDTDAIVRVRRSAICGSDLHLWHGALPVASPGFAVGHEFVGIVEETGAGVRGVRKGDRVLASCTTGCGGCTSCRRGLWSGCSVTTAGGVQNVFGFSAALPGGQAEAVRVPFADTNLFRIPEAVGDEAALLLTDVLPTAAMGAELAEVAPGDTVVVIGCGPVGSLAQHCALLRGAARVVAVDLDEARLARARARGCETVNPGHEDLGARVLELTHGEGADAVIEAVGRPELVQRALTLARAGGRIAAIGVVAAPVELPFLLLFLRNLSLRSGLVNPQRFIPQLLPLLESGRLDPTEIVTHRLALADGVRGYRMFDAHEEGALKVVLTAP
jgi:2-desacetyl-2-hydroxyethyl bacteriochlorophyllide A dehydrogenase